MAPSGFHPDDGWNDGLEPSAADFADEQLADRAAALMCIDSRVRGRSLRLEVQNQVIILSGDVESDQIRGAIGNLAWVVPGTFDVCNCLTVRGRDVTDMDIDVN